jgi:hypothetical protein
MFKQSVSFLAASPFHFLHRRFFAAAGVRTRCVPVSFLGLTFALLGGGLASRAAADVITYTTLNVPGGTDTTAHGLDGSTVVGSYNAGGTQHGYSYNGAAYTPFDVPASAQTFAQDVEGSTIVGIFTDTGDAGGHLHGFTYNGSTYTNLPDHPLGTDQTNYAGIFGSTLVGSYNDGGGMSHGFSFDGSTFVTLDYPLATGGTRALGVYGSNIVGSYEDGSGGHAFLYDGSTYTDLDIPLSPNTSAEGIYGSTVVGTYYDTPAGPVHGFITTVPEPACLSLACLAASALLARRRALALPVG